MGLYRNTVTNDVQEAYGATGDWLLNREPKGTWVEVAVEEPGELKGQALTDALEAAGLSKSGNVDEKRARLAQYNAELLAQNTGPSPDEVEDNDTDPGQGQ